MSFGELLPLTLAWLGTFILVWRLFPHHKKPTNLEAPFETWPKVSIVVPARNEEHNISNLLASLTNLSYPNYEIVLVNDQSSDQTRSIAESYGVRVIDTTPTPKSWNGKNWACHQAISFLTGDIFLFSDADTTHIKDSLERSVSYFVKSKADMMSALPFHRVEAWWEKLMGPFYSVLLASTSLYAPKKNRLFAIGQYLMFSRESYAKQEGHQAVFNQYPDDLALANACLSNGGKFTIYNGPPLFSVRMYSTLKQFISGWRRNFLAGIKQSSSSASIEVCLIFFGLLGAGRLFTGWEYAVPAILSGLFILFNQKRWGAFSSAGIVLMPFSLSVFCLCTLLAMWDLCTGNKLKWKGRQYDNWSDKIAPK